MRIYKVYSDSPSDKQLDDFCDALERGETMIWKADGRYAFACDALNPKAIDRICNIKRKNPDKALLSIACPNISVAAEYVRIDNEMFRLLKENTPGPFTFIFKTGNKLPRAFKGRKTAGIRIPANSSALALLEKFGRPVLTTTLPADDPDYALNPELIAEKYSSMVDFLIDSGDGDLLETTVLDCQNSEPEMVREGAGILN